MTSPSSVRSRANDAALVLGLFWCVGGIELNAPQLDRVFLLVAGAVLLGLSLRGHPQGPFIVWYAFLIGASERFSRTPLLDGSDVLRATQEGIVNLLQGMNPYTVPLTSTIPPGSPLVYPPGELLWYLPAHLAFGDLTLVLRRLAVAGRDWRRYAIVSVATVAVLVLPFLVWDPRAFLSAQLAILTFHTEVWGANLLALLQQYTDVTGWLPFFFAAEIIVTLGTFALLLRARLSTLGIATFGGCVVILIALLLARWTTQPYYAYLGGVAAMALALVDRDARVERAGAGPDADARQGQGFTSRS